MRFAVFALSRLGCAFKMLDTGHDHQSFRVLLRDSMRRREATLDEFRERVAGFLAIAMVMAVPFYGFVSGMEFSLVEESEAAEPFTGLQGFGPPGFNQQAVMNRLEANELSQSDIRTLQARLKRAGFNPGPADGIVGKRTLKALNAYRHSINLPPVLAVSRATIAELPPR